MIVSTSSQINSFSDLYGRNFCPGAKLSTTVDEVTTHFNEYDKTLCNSCNFIYASFDESIDLLKPNQIDGTWIMVGVPNSSVSTMLSDGNGKLLSLPSSLISTLCNHYPWYARYVIPADTYVNQPKDIETTAVKLVLFASASLDDNIVYDITKCLWENIDELKSENPALTSTYKEGAVTDLAGLPLHDGAKRYYKEIGVLD